MNRLCPLNPRRVQSPCMSTAWLSEPAYLRCCSVLLAHLLPAFAADAVVDVAAEGIALGEARIVEIASGIALHADALHDVDGARVGGYRDGDDLPAAERGEGRVSDARALSGIAWPQYALARR